MANTKHVWYVVYSFATIAGTSGFGAIDMFTDFATITTFKQINTMRDAISAHIGSGSNIVIFSWTYLRAENTPDERTALNS